MSKLKDLITKTNMKRDGLGRWITSSDTRDIFYTDGFHLIRVDCVPTDDPMYHPVKSMTREWAYYFGEVHGYVRFTGVTVKGFHVVAFMNPDGSVSKALVEVKELEAVLGKKFEHNTKITVWRKGTEKTFALFDMSQGVGLFVSELTIYKKANDMIHAVTMVANLDTWLNQ